METSIKIAGTKKESLIDGPGVSFVVFLQGCLQNCPGCHNPETQSPDGGYRVSIDEVFNDIASSCGIDTVVFSGGEPFLQAVPLSYLAKRLKEKKYLIVVYSGYTFEYLSGNSSPDNGYLKLLQLTDLLIDGPFLEQEKNLNLAFRGSENQRIINVPASLGEGCPVLSELN